MSLSPLVSRRDTTLRTSLTTVGDRESRNVPDALDAVRLARDVLSELDLEVVLGVCLSPPASCRARGTRRSGCSTSHEPRSSGSSRSGSTRTTRGRIGELPTRPRGARRADRASGAAAAGGCGRAPALLRLSARPPADEDVPGRPGGGRRRPVREPVPDREGGRRGVHRGGRGDGRGAGGVRGRGDRPRAALLRLGRAARRAGADRRRARRDACRSRGRSAARPTWI